MPELSPELQKILDKLNAEQAAKRKIEWDAAQGAHFPKPDVTPYVSNTAEIERLVKKYSNKSIRPQWLYRTEELMEEEGMTEVDASITAWREGREVEAVDPVDLMSMATGGDSGTDLAEIEKYDEMRKVLQNEYNNWTPSEIAMR